MSPSALTQIRASSLLREDAFRALRVGIVTGEIAAGKLYSAPTVREEIDSESAQISGSFTDREAFDLANVLNNPLDLPLVVKEQYEVGPSLASDSVVSAQKAFIISSILTIGFIVAFYTIGGFVANAGPNPNRLAGGAVENAQLQVQFSSAISQLQARLTNCQANPGGPGCPALLARQSKPLQVNCSR